MPRTHYVCGLLLALQLLPHPTVLPLVVQQHCHRPRPVPAYNVVLDGVPDHDALAGEDAPRLADVQQGGGGGFVGEAAFPGVELVRNCMEGVQDGSGLCGTGERRGRKGGIEIHTSPHLHSRVMAGRKWLSCSGVIWLSWK